jgi:hypothetical protein
MMTNYSIVGPYDYADSIDNEYRGMDYAVDFAGSMADYIYRKVRPHNSGVPWETQDVDLTVTDETTGESVTFTRTI